MKNPSKAVLLRRRIVLVSDAQGLIPGNYLFVSSAK